MLAAIEAGLPVLGYLHWTLMDNFEWIFGYGHQFGLHCVDRVTFERQPKLSAATYSRIAGLGRSEERRQYPENP